MTPSPFEVRPAPGPTRPIRFLVSNLWGSAIIRGFQLAEQLAAWGYDAAVLGAQSQAVSEVKNAIVVFVKFVEPVVFQRVKENNNVAVWNLVDIVVERSNMPQGLCFDGVIFPTQRARLDYGDQFGPRVKSTVIWSHADRRWRPARQRRFRLGYLGSQRSFDLRYRNIAGLHLVDAPISGHGPEIEEFFRRARWYSCHFSVRPADSDHFLYKPNAKLVAAAASGANIILSRDPVNLELLSPEYPYFTDSDVESVTRTIAFARATYRNTEWHRGLELLRGVRERTTRERIARDYLDYFRAFD